VVRFQPLCRHVLFSPDFIKMFDYMQLPTFEIASDAAASFREVLTRHKALVAEYLEVGGLSGLRVGGSGSFGILEFWVSVSWVQG